MNEKVLKLAGQEYKKRYGGAAFYDLALEIVDAHPVQAAIIILATWNTARFRFMANNAKNLNDLQSAIAKCKPWFQKLKDQRFQTANFDNIGNQMAQIYSCLTKVKGAEYTGGSKVMHILNPWLFLIWDDKMRRHYGYSGNDPDDYLAYHKQLQKKAKNIQWMSQTKTLPKAIDEYHFITITNKIKLKLD